MLHTLYRISDGGNKKNKLQHANKLHCINNYIRVFGKENLVVFADNCYKETIDSFNALGVKIIELPNLGNALSFFEILNHAIDNFHDDDYVYFLEDDYLHLEGAKETLLEGLEIADYVTLYDNPDKYIDFNNGGYNHYVLQNGEESKVFLTKTSHWRVTSSTTMTFAARVKTLKMDYPIWSFYKTQDYLAFQRLITNSLGFSKDMQVLKNKLRDIPVSRPAGLKLYLKTINNHFKNKIYNKKRVLIVAIPGKATHVEVEFLSPLTNWDLV